MPRRGHRRGLRAGDPDVASGGTRPPAALTGNDTTPITLAGSVLGPPAYMPPEQAAGRLEDLDARRDVYALGGVLYRPAEIPPGFVQIPGGPFSWGGSFAGGNDEEEMSTRDLFIQKFSVTAGEYLVFLNDLFRAGRADEARRRTPRDAADRFLRETPAGFELAAPGDPAALAQADLPVIGVSWHDACAFAAWRSTREGPRLLSIGAFAAAESPYGVRDTAGCVSNWMLNAMEIPYLHYRGLRGGAWFIGPANSRIVYRRAFLPETTTRYYGFRLCLRTVRD